MDSKTCSKCGAVKLISEFYKKSSNKDGYESFCKPCRNAKIKAYRQTDAGKAVAKKAQQKYAKTEKGKANQYRKDRSEKGLARRKRFLAGATRKEWNEQYSTRPEVKERSREAARRYNQSERGRAYKRQYNARTDVKAKKAIYDRQRKSNLDLREMRLARARELSHQERNKAAKRAYQTSDAGRAVRSRANKKIYLNNPVKVKARRQLRSAISRGEIVRPGRCEECLTPGSVHGHHDDYAKPLAVRWLCPQCHNDWHRLNGPGING